MKTITINKILVPIDFSKTSLKALLFAVNIAKKYDSEIQLFHIVEGVEANKLWGNYVPPTYELEYNKKIRAESERQLKKIEELVIKKGVINVKSISGRGRIHKEIISISAKNKIDLIVMGTHGVSGLKKFFIGSNTFNVIRDAKCPVLSVQENVKAINFKNLLLPFRDKPHSREKVNYAIAIAEKFGAKIHVLGIDTEFTKAHTRKMELQAEQIKKIAEKSGVECNTKIISSLYKVDHILGQANKVKADMIVIMSDLDKMDISEYFTGPFSQQLVNHSPIPVLSIHPKFNPNTIDLTFY